MEKSEKRSGSGNDSIPYLSPEIISEILCKLPIASVLRCRCVCKAWRYLTKSPAFIEQLLSSNVDKAPSLLLETSCVENESTQPFLLVDVEQRRVRHIRIDPLEGLSAMSTCRGLVCVGSLSSLDPVYVFNPITREYRRLPASGEKDIEDHQVGLGFDPSTGKYKVLRTYVDDDEGKRCFEVTTLGASSWRKLDVPDHWQDYFVYEPVFWNKAIHWKASTTARDFLLSFDVCHEKFRKISFPKVFVPDLTSIIEPTELELLGFGGRLTIIEHEDEQMRLWEVTGDKLEDLSIWFWDEHDTHVLWNPYMTYKVIGRWSPEFYLLEVSTCHGDVENRRKLFTWFLPRRANYLPLDIPGVPSMFITAETFSPCT
ncbi:hypothetical protein EUGRSUZ_B00632 [Eucalyptus grandis]|uniref:Uncharacterized protein n=2 Tax=Eucalyptus grandis TaxID=71139 RepID=A0ACC3LMV8_EUCGR|nr:hypothetical protein EUGRSUZ_B00632 [Eucalyptus grandis]